MTREILEAVMATVHVLHVVPVKDGNQTNYSVVCLCGNWESGQHVSRRDAEAQAAGHCEVEIAVMDGQKRRAERLAMQTPARGAAA